MPFLTPCLGEGSPTKIVYRKKRTLILTSLLEDLVDHAADSVGDRICTIQRGIKVTCSDSNELGRVPMYTHGYAADHAPVEVEIKNPF